MKPKIECTWTPWTRGSVRAWRADPGEELAAVSGRLWITEEADPADIVLTAGQSLALTPGRRVVVEALDAAVVRHARLRRSGLRQRLTRLRAWLRDRWQAPPPYRRPGHAPLHGAGLE